MGTSTRIRGESSSSTRASTTLLALAVLATATVSDTAVAHDHHVPQANLKVAGETQSGRLYHLVWTKGDGKGCVAASGIGPRRFPPGLSVPSGSRTVKVDFAKSRKPTSLRIYRWNDVDDAGAAVGAPQRVSRELSMHRSKTGRTYWRAKFTLDVTAHDYLAVSGTWRDEEGCGGEQSADWTFHLAASEAPAK